MENCSSRNLDLRFTLISVKGGKKATRQYSSKQISLRCDNVVRIIGTEHFWQYLSIARNPLQPWAVCEVLMSAVYKLSTSYIRMMQFYEFDAETKSFLLLWKNLLSGTRAIVLRVVTETIAFRNSHNKNPLLYIQ